MKFTKMQGIGNDYVYVNCFKEEVKDPVELAKRVSDRHYGIGSDGLILIKPSTTADFFMDMYNADGSQSEMCGNGIRCVAKYVYDYGLTDKTNISVETLAGIKYLDLQLKNGKVSMVTVNMGSPELNPSKIPVKSEKDSLVNEPITAGGREYKMTCVSMGNPHCVVFVEDTEKFPLEEVGPVFERHALFPNRINAEFIQVLDRKTVNMRVWERGSGETLACGTGACASAVAGVLNGLTEEEITLHLLGGDLLVRWDREKNLVYMTGPAKVVFDGEIVDLDR
ncbi:MAG: diaminopimelate epimerase [Bacteroidales bacterium]|nr:diaminopimelate epimerase [Clostridium sp.]MCM1204797.1 diaminopimelate epimerase [Bacteroidales bacterium]